MGKTNSETMNGTNSSVQLKENDLLGSYLNQVHQGDCIEFMDKLPTNSIKVIVTSPPYNLKNSTGNGMKDGRGGKWSNAGLLNGYSEHSDDMPHDSYVEWQRDCLNSMMRVLTDDGVIFYNHKWRVQGGLLQDRHDIISGFPVRQIIIWNRSGGINFNRGYFLPTYEVIYMITKPEFKLKQGANKMTDIWRFHQERDNVHPAPFPLELPEKCISATIDGIVLDPFMGSGTTAVAAQKLKRNWIGIEKSEEYCKLATDRLRNL
jgi:modification methylase